MRCERAQDLMSDYHDGSLQPSLRIPLENHLSACGACRSQLAQLAAVWTLLDEMPVTAPPPGFRSAVWARINASEAAAQEKRAAGRRWQTLFRRPALAWASAAALLLFFAGIVVPGAYTRAGLGLNLWTSRVEKRQEYLTAGKPSQALEDGRIVVQIPLFLRGEGAAPADAEFRLVGPGAMAGESAGSIRLEPGAPALLSFPRLSGAPEEEVTLEVSWARGGLRHRQTLRVRLPAGF